MIIERYICGCVLAILLGCLTSLAQGKVLSEAEFNAVWTNACEKTKTLSQVQTETYEKYNSDSKPPYYTYIRLRRYIPLDRVWVTAAPKDSGIEKRYEEIRIGQRSYSREGNNEWKSKEIGFSGLFYCTPESSTAAGKGNGSGSGTGEKSSTMRFEYEYQYMGRNGSADLYVKVKRMIITRDGKEEKTTFSNSYWINSAGAFLKSESQTRDSNGLRESREITEYDYAQKDLKIEAPIK